MFTHFASRSVFIDDDHYGGDESLGYWMAHELGHLAANSADENDAEKAVKPYRKRLKDAQLVSTHRESQTVVGVQSRYRSRCQNRLHLGVWSATIPLGLCQGSP